MAPGARSFARIIGILSRFQGGPPKPVTRDPFQLILLEQVAYLATDERRLEAYRKLEREVGLTPEAIAAAPASRLTAIARFGGATAAADRAGRMKESAELVLSRWDGRLRKALALPLAQARKALAAFPMIGPPGADRILAASGTHAVLGLDSNGLRVLLRLGWGQDSGQYAKSYRSVQEAVAPVLPAEPRALDAAAAVLRRHGQEICRRSAPACEVCPVMTLCEYVK